MAAKEICDRDCFNCKFEDCINDRMEIEDYIEGDKIDKDIIRERSQKKKRKLSPMAIKRKKEYHSENRDNPSSYAKAYYDLNRERYRKYRLENKERKSAYDRDYFSRNKKKITEKNKIYGAKNKEHLRERQKEWREKNRAKIKEYQRQYYLRKKSQNTEEK